MMVSVSLALLLAVATWLLIRYSGLRVFHALIAALFGFYLAKTALAPEIQRAIKGIADALSGFNIS